MVIAWQSNCLEIAGQFLVGVLGFAFVSLSLSACLVLVPNLGKPWFSCLPSCIGIPRHDGEKDSTRIAR